MLHDEQVACNSELLLFASASYFQSQPRSWEPQAVGSPARSPLPS